MISDYKKLASELASNLAQFKPSQPAQISPSDRHRIVNRLYAQRRRQNFFRRGLNSIGRKYRNKMICIKRLFPAIAQHFGISTDAARMRYYRGQVPKSVLVECAKN